MVRPGQVPSGSLFSFVYSVTNLGPALAVDVCLEGFVPSTVRLGFRPPDCDFVPFQFGGTIGTIVSCELGNIAPGQTVNVFLDVAAPLVGVPTLLFGDVDVISANDELNALNNFDLVELLVVPLDPRPTTARTSPS